MGKIGFISLKSLCLVKIGSIGLSVLHLANVKFVWSNGLDMSKVGCFAKWVLFGENRFCLSKRVVFSEISCIWLYWLYLFKMVVIW